MIGLLVGVGYTSAVADSQAESTVARDTWVADETTIVFGEPMNNVFPGMMFAEKKDVGYIDRKLCGNTPINECASDGYFFDYRAIFPPCANVLSNNCIDGVWAVDESGQKIELKAATLIGSNKLAHLLSTFIQVPLALLRCNFSST